MSPRDGAAIPHKLPNAHFMNGLNHIPNPSQEMTGFQGGRPVNPSCCTALGKLVEGAVGRQ